MSTFSMLRLACVAACVAAVAGELLAAKKAPAPPAAHVYNKPKEDFVRAPYMQLEGSRKLDCEGCKRITRKVRGSGRSATRRSAAMACWCLPTVCQVNAEASSPQGLSPGCLLRLPLATRSTIQSRSVADTPPPPTPCHLQRLFLCCRR